MVVNKNEWAVLDSVQCILGKMSKYMTDNDKEKVNNFIFLCAKATKEEKERREKTAKYIATKRKINPNYARPKSEHIKTKKEV